MIENSTAAAATAVVAATAAVTLHRCV